MAKGKLSERQSEMIEFIGRFTQDKGYPPTIRQIGEAVNISSTSVVNYNLNKLERDGYTVWRNPHTFDVAAPHGIEVRPDGTLHGGADPGHDGMAMAV